VTEACHVALIFDEVVTGFRTDAGGMQHLLGIKADLAIYGKMLAGGMPIGVVAGKKEYLNRIDGGTWDYDKEINYPEDNTTFAAGTFCRNPLTMAVSLAVLNQLKLNAGNNLQQALNRKTENLSRQLNLFFSSENMPLRVTSFSSIFRFSYEGNNSYIFQPFALDLFHHLLLYHGLFSWEARTCFLSVAHSENDINEIINIVKRVATQIKSLGFFTSNATVMKGMQHA